MDKNDFHGEIMSADPKKYHELFKAVFDGSYDRVKQSLDLGLYVDHELHGGQTALTLSCLYGHVDVVRLLLDSHADVEKANMDGDTPLMCAVRGSNVKAHLPILEMLILHEPRVDHRNNEGKDVLDLVISSKTSKFIQAYWDKKQLDKSIDNDMRTELIHF